MGSTTDDVKERQYHLYCGGISSVLTGGGKHQYSI